VTPYAWLQEVVRDVEAGFRATRQHLVEAGRGGFLKIHELEGGWETLLEDLGALEERCADPQPHCACRMRDKVLRMLTSCLIRGQGDGIWCRWSAEPRRALCQALSCPQRWPVAYSSLACACVHSWSNGLPVHFLFLPLVWLLFISFCKGAHSKFPKDDHS
jgi:hypothetical protein